MRLPLGESPTWSQVEAQVQIAETRARVDLCDTRLRLVIEAEGFDTHGIRTAFGEDCARYTSLVCLGYLVLRFTYAQAMRDPDWVTGQLTEAVALAEIRATVPSGRKLARTTAGERL